jgi:thioredoxin 2
LKSAVVICSVCGTKNRVPAAAAGVPRCGNCHSPLPWIVTAQDTDFAEIVDGPGIPVLLDLWAPWCGPCRAVSPALEALARQFAGRLKLVKVNVDEAPEVGRRFEVQGIPTLVVLDGGRVRSRKTGAAPEPELREWLERSLSSVTESNTGTGGRNVN